MNQQADVRHGAATTVAFGHLSAALAHEVRNPLNSMAIHLELIAFSQILAGAQIIKMSGGLQCGLEGDRLLEAFISSRLLEIL